MQKTYFNVLKNIRFLKIKKKRLRASCSALKNKIIFK